MYVYAFVCLYVCGCGCGCMHLDVCVYGYANMRVCVLICIYVDGSIISAPYLVAHVSVAEATRITLIVVQLSHPD